MFMLLFGTVFAAFDAVLTVFLGCICCLDQHLLQLIAASFAMYMLLFGTVFAAFGTVFPVFSAVFAVFLCSALALLV